MGGLQTCCLWSSESNQKARPETLVDISQSLDAFSTCKLDAVKGYRGAASFPGHNFLFLPHFFAARLSLADPSVNTERSPLSFPLLVVPHHGRRLLVASSFLGHTRLCTSSAVRPARKFSGFHIARSAGTSLLAMLCLSRERCFVNTVAKPWHRGSPLLEAGVCGSSARCPQRAPCLILLV